MYTHTPTKWIDIFDRKENKYEPLYQHAIFENNELLFSLDFLKKEVPLLFLIVWNDPVKLWLEYLKLKRDIGVIERDKILQEKRINEQLET